MRYLLLIALGLLLGGAAVVAVLAWRQQGNAARQEEQRFLRCNSQWLTQDRRPGAFV